MPTRIEAQVTPEGLLIPRAAIREWLEEGIEVVKEEERIVIQPRPAPPTERERVLQILEEAGLLLPPEPLPPDYKPVSPEEQAELARKFSVGRPLSLSPVSMVSLASKKSSRPSFPRPKSSEPGPFATSS